ncbi:uncharacterized protein LOC126831152, partial [Patella vulgata]|uniref:uncharacterized protein LOC126831152 n=1 Tax=Patella vulgata TaxID=6465 RepID=UPI0024A98C34
MTLYDKYLSCHDAYCLHLSNEDRAAYYDDFFEDRDVYLSNFMSSTKNWFVQTEGIATPTKPVCAKEKSVRSSHRSSHRSSSHCSSSHRSDISSLKFHEEQKNLELSAKVEALRQRKDIEAKRLELEFIEKELDLKTELAISQGKSKLYERYAPSSKDEASSVVGEVKENTDSNVKVKDSNDIISSDACNTTYNVDRTVRETVNTCNDDNSFDKLTIRPTHKQCEFNKDVSPFENKPDSVSANLVPDQNLTPHNAEGALYSMIKHIKKPNTSIQPFDGNILEYQRFIRQFNSVIVTNCDTYDERLNFLDQFTSGEANKIVRSYSYLRADKAYDCALSQLQSRYGNSELIANAFIEKALHWPVIKSDNPKGLDDFALFLTECLHAVKSIEAVNILEYSENIKRILQKLPYFIHDKWRNIVQSTRDKGHSVHFDQLVELINTEALKANDPTYGKKALLGDRLLSTPIRKSHVQVHANRPKGSFAIQQVNSRPNEQSTYMYTRPYNTDIAFTKPCCYCKHPSHSMFVCKQLSSLPESVKKDFVKSKRLCFGCLKPGHILQYCSKKTKCPNNECDESHHPVLHDNKNNNQTKTDQKPVVASTLSNDMEAGNHNDSPCTMAIIPVMVKTKNGHNVVETYAFLDPGSNVSFCTENLMRQLSCNGKRTKLTFDTMGSTHTLNSFVIHGMQVCDLTLCNTVDLPTIYTKDCIPVSHDHIPTTNDLSKWPHLSGIDIPVLNAEIGLLIGNNVPNAYSPIEVKTGPSDSPHAVLSSLGWIIWNLIRDSSSLVNTVNRLDVQAVQNFEDLRVLVQRTTKFDFPERSIDDVRENSQEDNAFIRKVNQTINFENGHYTIGLPFRDEFILLPNNRVQAECRLNSLQNKMRRDTNYCNDYIKFMTKIICNGYAEVVPDSQVNRDDGQVWYIPHHGVYHPRKPGELRVVFDCAAMYDGISLNRQLLQGPDMTNTLTGVLIRFRQDNTAIMGDIEKMFYQVRVPECDRDFLRFLWWPNGDTSCTPNTYRMVVHLFGAVSSPSCANLALRQTAIDNSHLFDDNIVSSILKNFYVDDLLKSLKDCSSAVEFVKDICAICENGGFRLTKWVSNERNVLHAIPVNERAKDIKELNLDCELLPVEHALGIRWVVESDVLKFSVKLDKLSVTRRGILSAASSIYDPLGLVSPFVLPAKLLLQSLCQQNLNWDDVIPETDLHTWHQFLNNLSGLENFKIPRSYKPANFGKIVSSQIHTFSDASNIGYGAVTYIRLVNEDCKIHCALMFSKSRVAPLKKLTVPRLELTAATVAVRLTNMLVKELEIQIDNMFYWTDSMSVLEYIRN